MQLSSSATKDRSDLIVNAKTARMSLTSTPGLAGSDHRCRKSLGAAEWRSERRRYRDHTAKRINRKELCNRCRKMDFQRAFEICTGQIKPGNNKRVSNVHQGPVFPIDCGGFGNRYEVGFFNGQNIPSGCGLCQFFARVLRQSQKDKEGKSLIGVVALPACKKRKGILHKEDAKKGIVMVKFESYESGARDLNIPLAIMNNDSKEEEAARTTMCHSWGFIEERLIIDWVRGCTDETHKEICTNMPYGNVQDLMVINCVTRRLEKLPTRTEYVCLSYRWGVGERVPPVSSGNLPSSMAPLIEDCILLVKLLGLKYLWVDRYCIPQDNPRKRRRLIRLMGSIYSNTLLTIIAAAGKDPSYGLPGVGFPRENIPPVFIDSMALIPWNCRAHNDIAGSVERSEWNERAWTYQEALLSRRRLVFADNGLYFQCGQACGIEKLSTTLFDFNTLHQPTTLDRISAYFPELNDSNSQAYYERCVMDYSLRKLSNQNDVLDAFQGIVQNTLRFGTIASSLAGLPILDEASSSKGSLSRRLANTLLWSTCFENKIENRQWEATKQARLQGEDRRRYGLPSWTCLGWTYENAS